MEGVSPEAVAEPATTLTERESTGMKGEGGDRSTTSPLQRADGTRASGKRPGTRGVWDVGALGEDGGTGAPLGNTMV